MAALIALTTFSAFPSGSSRAAPPGYPLVLANESTGTRAWVSTLCEIAICDSALSPTQMADNHNAGCDLTAPTP